MTDLLAFGLIGAGLFFFAAGTVALLRFPDTLTRLHALTKADNLGLGLVALGLALRAGEAATAALLVLIWLLALAASASLATLLGRAAVRRDPGEPGP
ncbi:cation:proton antiporter [Thiohalorhabdus denitrificans]|uniref:Multisubunit sodium/proton antiporter, MrpG subunit (TC 2.A.63.1) n=1 Tax=Thiohalorhabdus denitrificans TaxID=381306 RepID=A0A0P9CWK1_9GAMM|nr:monovalent cation/H(+) antiporter subunit G [Thiohalorhabdus denitrificans]KPV41090.1 cation:proton antiporter [Thiohalorhabdus denitrificans]SCY38851.1 multisubunit sodium/proton antiporter, MrpG subunit (TC 2.A.63.1) [Thiohalorhabdus denitrificans]